MEEKGRLFIKSGSPKLLCGLTGEEFCQAKLLCQSAKLLSGQAELLCCLLGKEFDSTKLLCYSARLLFGQARTFCCRAKLLSYSAELLSGRLKLLGNRVALVAYFLPFLSQPAALPQQVDIERPKSVAMIALALAMLAQEVEGFCWVDGAAVFGQ